MACRYQSDAVDTRCRVTSTEAERAADQFFRRRSKGVGMAHVELVG